MSLKDKKLSPVLSIIPPETVDPLLSVAAPVVMIEPSSVIHSRSTSSAPASISVLRRDTYAGLSYENSLTASYICAAFTVCRVDASPVIFSNPPGSDTVNG